MTGLALLRDPAPAPVNIDTAKASQAAQAAAEGRAARDRAAYEEVTVPLNFPADGSPLRVLYSGDSNMAGFYSSTEDKAFRPLVTAALGTRGPVEEVHTYKPGATTTYISDNFKVPENIGLAVISIGTNWSREDGDAVAFGNRYSTYLASIKAASPGAEILCLGIWARTNAETAPFVEEIATECKANGGRFVDLAPLYVARDNLSGPAGVQTWAGISDSSHPNDSGHRAIADEILERIRS